jgi:hypothetical protein
VLSLNICLENRILGFADGIIGRQFFALMQHFTTSDHKDASSGNWNNESYFLPSLGLYGGCSKHSRQNCCKKALSVRCFEVVAAGTSSWPSEEAVWVVTDAKLMRKFKKLCHSGSLCEE